MFFWELYTAHVFLMGDLSSGFLMIRDTEHHQQEDMEEEDMEAHRPLQEEEDTVHHHRTRMARLPLL